MQQAIIFWQNLLRKHPFKHLLCFLTTGFSRLITGSSWQRIDLALHLYRRQIEKFFSGEFRKRGIRGKEERFGERRRESFWVTSICLLRLLRLTRIRQVMEEIAADRRIYVAALLNGNFVTFQAGLIRLTLAPAIFLPVMVRKRPRVQTMIVLLTMMSSRCATSLLTQAKCVETVC